MCTLFSVINKIGEYVKGTNTDKINVSNTTFYPRDAMLARVFAIATCLSVRPSVCLSVTRRYCA